MHAVCVAAAKLDERVIVALEEMLVAGNYLKTAAVAAGISEPTLHRWLVRGESGRPADALYRELRERVQRARAQGEAALVARIAAAAEDSWQAAAWLLEREYPERWAKPSVRERAPIETPPAVPADDEDGLSDDDPFTELDELAAARRRRAEV
jgi:hypothetical protein